MREPWRIRPADDADVPAIVELARASLGWDADPRHEKIFRWKHQQNHFGPSYMWVAESDDGLVGFRAMMRWAFTTPTGEVLTAVRAVDTATHPRRQRQGIFAALTRHALVALADDGVGFVFNTPNDRSRPGYLALGWRPVGRVPVSLRPRSPLALPRLRGARVAADKWSLPTAAGHPVDTTVADLVAARRPRPDSGVATAGDADFIRWRYGEASLGYRVLDTDGGTAVFRLRRRGTAVEATICSLPADPSRLDTGRAVRSVLDATDADYALVSGVGWGGGIPVPLGPVLVSRALCAIPPASVADWHLDLGDVELF